MKTLAQLKQERAAKLQAAKALVAAAQTGNRELTAEELASVQTLTGEAAALKTQIEAKEAQAALVAQLDADVADLGEVPAPRAGRSAAVVENARERSAADPNAGFRTPREFMSAVMAHGMGGPLDRRLQPLRVQRQAAAGGDEQSEFSDSYGGFSLPEGFRPELLTVQAEGDPTVGRTQAVPMSTVSVKIPARTDKNHTTSVTGGLRFYRRAEGDTSATSRMEMEQVELRANPLMGIAFATEELLADSPLSFAAIIQAGFATELGSQVLDEKIRGTGAGQYLGVLNSPALISVAKEAGQGTKTLVYNNILKMRARCWGYKNAIWLANHDAFPQLATMSIPVGTGGAPVYVTSAQEDRPDMLLGRPIFYTEYCETVGTAGDLICANWSQYLEGQLQGMQMQDSIHVRFVNNERCFKVTARNDGRPWWRSALTPRKSSDTLSPFVALAAR